MKYLLRLMFSCTPEIIVLEERVVQYTLFVVPFLAFPWIMVFEGGFSLVRSVLPVSRQCWT